MTMIVSVEEGLPSTFESYDFSGMDVLVSNIVNTNKGLAVLKNGEWRSVDWDCSEVDVRITGVTHWEEIQDIIVEGNVEESSL